MHGQTLTRLAVLASTLLVASLQAQQGPASNSATAVPADLGATLSQIDQLSQATAADVKALRLDQWKTDADTRQQARRNAESLARNLTAALPGMIQEVRANPASAAAQFKLYRNLNALFDVLSWMTEAAGSYGSKADYQTLSNELDGIDRARQSLANRLESLTAQQDAEIKRLRTPVPQVAAAPPPPKKIIVDDTEPARKPTKAASKKKSAPAATTPPKQ